MNLSASVSFSVMQSGWAVIICASGLQKAG